MKKFLSIILVLALVSVLFAGCAKENPSSSNPSSETSSNSTFATIVDQLGRKVTIEKQPTKIISSYNISTSLIIALDKDKDLVGIEMKAKEREIYKKAAPHLLDLPQIGSGKSINVEECLKLNPDVVIIPVRLKEFIPKFEALNIPVIAVEPENLELFLESINIIGTAIGAKDKADQLVRYYNDKISEVKKLTQGLTEKPKVYLTGTKDPLTTCTSKMYQNYVIELAGGDNVTKDLTEGYWTTISAEQLVKYNPEVIFNLSYSTYKLDDIYKDSKFKDITAVKNKQLYTFPSNLEAWDYPTPSSILGVLWLLQTLHPDLYAKDQYVKEAKEFYKTFYGIEITDTEIGVN